jgi:hypothetical protein
MKWRDITPPPWFCFLQKYWKISSNKPESCFVKRVNTCEGCRYHSWQDNTPSLALSNQMKWWDITPPPWFSFPQEYWKMSSNKPESCFVKRVNTHKGCWYHSWQDNNPSLTLSNQMKWQDVTPPLWFSFPQEYWKMSSNKHESCFDKRVNTHEGCWYHSWQDNDPSLTPSNHMKWRDITPLILFPTMIMKDVQHYTWILFCQKS